jgi:hypothetical protein
MLGFIRESLGVIMADRKETDEQAGEFKVVDRRLFTPEGERRPDSEIEAPPEKPAEKPSATTPPPQPPVHEPPPRQPPVTEPPHPKSEPERTAHPGEAASPVKFEHLVMSLVTTAMFQMGFAAKPGDPPSPPDLPAAQETIEILTVLQQKTKGNLTREEEEILSGSLYELRMAFVELSRATGRRH